ncbi:beta-lactamase family protein [Stenotrophomonas sp. CPCC 101365]|uniref:Beta-lactamase family protein n=2 Tax=Stenotrophomonas mori TaxID=2871096 RepID=A0ABT0SCQ5_9GAMM|nr:beta-lactamase family protein [Stenotrophomonas mori]
MGGSGTGTLHRRGFLASASACGVAALLPAAAPRAAAAVAADRPWIPSDAVLEALPEWMRAFGVPGVGIAVVEQGELAWHRGFGLADIQRGTAVDADSVFECASLSKPVFAYLVLQLVDAGVLRLDGALVDYHRPAYLAVDDPWLERITVRDVLRHSSGLPGWRADPGHEALRTRAAPGERVDYSGEAFFWLQLAVEHVTGQSLDQLARRRLFGPAGMRGSTFAWDAHAARHSVVGVPAPGAAPVVQTFGRQWPLLEPLARARGKPLPAWTWDDAVRALPQARAAAPEGMFTWPGDLLANAAASLRGPVQDYARFLCHVLPRPQRQGWEIAEATRQAMLAPQLPVRPEWLYKSLGWNLERIDARTHWFFHGGANAGRYRTFAVGDPQRRRALVVMTSGGGGTGVYQRIVRAATGRDLLAFDL